MSAATLLEKLDSVKRIGVDRWIARCPAHADKRPSLAVRELDDGRVLVHDFAGCAVGDVLAAVGLKFDDLFPPRTDAHSIKGERRPFPATDVLRAVCHEALIAATAASLLGNGGTLTNGDRARLLLASSRITTAVQESGHA